MFLYLKIAHIFKEVTVMKIMLILISLALLATSTISIASEEMEDEIIALYSFFDGNADDAAGHHPGELFGDASFVS